MAKDALQALQFSIVTKFHNVDQYNTLARKINCLNDKLRTLYNHVDDINLINGGQAFINPTCFDLKFDFSQLERDPQIELLNQLPFIFHTMDTTVIRIQHDYLARMISMSKAPWLLANIVHCRTKEAYYHSPYVIQEIDGVKIAFIGIVSDMAKGPLTESEDDVRESIDSKYAIQKWVRFIHESEQVDYLVVIYPNQLFESDLTYLSEGVDLIIAHDEHFEERSISSSQILYKLPQDQELHHFKLKFKKHPTTYELLSIDVDHFNIEEG